MTPDWGNPHRSSTTRKDRGKRAAVAGSNGMEGLPKAPPVSSPLFRIGLGNDVHRLEAGRKLILGGVRIPFDKGPAGHSDGDALAHAICDCLLGAARLGDIGRHFRNTDPRWKNASSLLFLRHVRQLLDAAGYSIVNIDATVGIERPKLMAHIAAMEKKVAGALSVRPEQVSVKAKSGEGLDAIGRGEAVRADAVALVQSRPLP